MSSCQSAALMSQMASTAATSLSIPQTANAYAQQQLYISDAQQAQTIQSQIAADTQKNQMRRWQIAVDTQTKIFEIQQDVTVNKAKTEDKMFQKWDQYIQS